MRRHMPSTLALIPTQRSVDVLVAALDAPDGFVRYKALPALGRMRREHPELSIPTAPIEALVVQGDEPLFQLPGLHHNLFVAGGLDRRIPCWPARSRRSIAARVDRIFRLLALIYPWKDIAAARWTLEHAPAARARARSSTSTTCSTGQMRKRVIRCWTSAARREGAARQRAPSRPACATSRTAWRSWCTTTDQIIAAAAIQFVEHREYVGARRRSGARARAPRPARLVRVRGGVVGAGGAADGGRTSGARAGWSRCRPSSSPTGSGACALFDFVSVDELFRIADAGRQVRHEPGACFTRRAATPDDPAVPARRRRAA